MTDRQQLYFCEYYLRGKSILVIAQEQGVNKTTVARGTRRGMEKVVEVFADIEIIEKEGEKVAQFKTRYGVYKDLEKSPYEYTNPYGDKFKFRSQKKLEIYEREIVLEIDRVSKFLSRLDLESYIPSEITGMIYRRTYQALYDRIER